MKRIGSKTKKAILVTRGYQQKHGAARVYRPRASTRSLTVRQRRFVDAYAGDIRVAAKVANLSYGYARRLVSKSHIIAAIQSREIEGRKERIVNRQKLQAAWSAMMDDVRLPPMTRLRASELLARSAGYFIQKHEHKVLQGTFMQLIAGDVSVEQLDEEGRDKLRDFLERLHKEWPKYG